MIITYKTIYIFKKLQFILEKIVFLKSIVQLIIYLY